MSPTAELWKWIAEHTKGSNTVVEMGAGKFNVVDSAVHSTVRRKVGIEIYEPYVTGAHRRQCERICGDMRDFRELLDSRQIEMDCALLVDSLEHLDKDDAYQFIDDMQDRFGRILLFVPLGEHPQQADPWESGNDEHMKHRSSWQPLDLEAVGFAVEVDSGFHGPKGGAMMCRWDREDS